MHLMFLVLKNHTNLFAEHHSPYRLTLTPFDPSRPLAPVAPVLPCH